MVKFSARADARDTGPVEQAYAAMARAAGIDMPQTRLFRASKDRAYFGVQRFDRGSDDETYVLRTNMDIVIAFTIARDTVTILSIFRDETLNKFTATAARSAP